MEAATGVPNGGRVVSLPSSSTTVVVHPVRKEWRAISEHSLRNSPTPPPPHEEMERLKLGQSSDERTIYEVQQGTASLHPDYCSITLDDNNLMQQRLHDISSQRERMQQMETELRAQLISRSQIMDMQNTFTNQINEQVNAAAKLKEHLQEREQAIHELELKMEEKERELRAIKIDSEAAWAKEDLIREQNKELLAYRRERDNYEAERAQQLQQVHELKEHIQEKERQFLELEEQHRVLQETVLYKDEQLREAQAWVAQMDAMQSTTHHSLQTELRERTEQFNHFWHGCQRQFADMERHHLQAIHQLQLELAEARQRSGTYTEEASLDRSNSEEASSFGQIKGTQFNVNEDGTLTGNPGVHPNGNINIYPQSVKSEHEPGVPIPSSVPGLGAYVPPGQVAALHPLFIPQHGIPHSLPHNSLNHESLMGHYMPMPAIPSHQDWQNQQAVADGSQLSSQNQYQSSQTEQNISSSSGHYDYEHSADGRKSHPDYLVSNIVPSQEAGSAITTSREEAQVLEPNGKQNLVYLQPEQKQHESSPHFPKDLGLNSVENIETKDQIDSTAMQHSKEGHDMITEKLPAASAPLSSTSGHSLNPGVSTECNGGDVVLPESSISTGPTSNMLASGKALESRLLDEGSLLACVVRAIPAGSGGRIRISSTLPNRLGKMLAPLHWHDYKKKYGKLDDFVSGHPELFVIEGDFIQLREGAQGIISATAAIAKVAAAARASTPYSSLFPSVAVTPIAQPHRLKKVSLIDPKPANIGSSDTVLASADAGDKSSQQLMMQNHSANGVSNIVQGLTNVKILSKAKHQQELNGYQSEMRSGQSSVQASHGNGTNSDGARSTFHQNKLTTNGRQGMSFGVKQQGRDAGVAYFSRQ